MKYLMMTALVALSSAAAHAREFKLVDRGIPEWSNSICTPQMKAQAGKSNAVSLGDIILFQSGDRRYDDLKLITDSKSVFYHVMFDNAEYQALAARYNDNVQFFRSSSALSERKLWDLLKPILERHGVFKKTVHSQYGVLTDMFYVSCTPSLQTETYADPRNTCPASLPADIKGYNNISLSVDCLGTSQDFPNATEVKITYSNYRSEQIRNFFIEQKAENEKAHGIPASWTGVLREGAEKCRRNPYCTQLGNEELSVQDYSLTVKVPPYSNHDRYSAFAADFQQKTLLPFARELDVVMSQLRAKHDVQLTASDF